MEIAAKLEILADAAKYDASCASSVRNAASDANCGQDDLDASPVGGAERGFTDCASRALPNFG